MILLQHETDRGKKIMKSARDITNMAATNRQAVYRYIKKHHIKEKTLDETGKRLYDDETAPDCHYPVLMLEIHQKIISSFFIRPNVPIRL